MARVQSKSAVMIQKKRQKMVSKPRRGLALSHRCPRARSKNPRQPTGFTALTTYTGPLRMATAHNPKGLPYLLGTVYPCGYLSMDKNDNSSHTVEALMSRMQGLKPKGPLRDKDEIALAAAVVLIEIASSDNVIDKHERTVILSALKSLFRVSDETANGLINRAKAQLASMRGSSSAGEILRDSLDMPSKRAIAQVIDNLIRCNGVVDGIEIYLRKRFRDILGVSEEMLNHVE